MKLHMVITDEQMKVKPSTIDVINEWGPITVVFNEGKLFLSGLHCFIEGEEKDIKNWLRPFNRIIVGNGSPMMESFSLQHVGD